MGALKFRKIKVSSIRGKLMKECDKLFALYAKKILGENCQIHENDKCDRIGTMHLLSKQAHPRLRYCIDNIARACWFGSHFWTHHNPDDPRAIKARERILEIKGCKTWKELKTKLLIAEKQMQKHDTLYLEALKIFYENELRQYKD